MRGSTKIGSSTNHIELNGVCVCGGGERGRGKGFVFLCVYAVLASRIRDKLCTPHPHPYPAGDLSKFIEIVHQPTASLSLGFGFWWAGGARVESGNVLDDDDVIH